MNENPETQDLKVEVDASDMPENFIEAANAKRKEVLEKQLELMKSIREGLDDLPHIPVLTEWFRWKIGEAEATGGMWSENNPGTGQAFGSIKERVIYWARKEAEALGHAFGSTAEALSFVSAPGSAEANIGQGIEVAMEQIKGGKKGELVVKHAPDVVKWIAENKMSDSKDGGTKKLLEAVSQGLRLIFSDEGARNSFTEAVDNWSIWEDVEKYIGRKEPGDIQKNVQAVYD